MHKMNRIKKLKRLQILVNKNKQLNLLAKGILNVRKRADNIDKWGLKQLQIFICFKNKCYIDRGMYIPNWLAIYHLVFNLSI